MTERRQFVELVQCTDGSILMQSLVYRMLRSERVNKSIVVIHLSPAEAFTLGCELMHYATSTQLINLIMGPKGE